MKYGCLYAVKEIDEARKFYEELFDLTVVDDYGRNMAFDCGLALQQDFDWLVGILKEKMKSKEIIIFKSRKEVDDYLKIILN